jgi:hypothetical protein
MRRPHSTVVRYSSINISNFLSKDPDLTPRSRYVPCLRIICVYHTSSHMSKFRGSRHVEGYPAPGTIRVKSSAADKERSSPGTSLKPITGLPALNLPFNKMQEHEGTGSQMACGPSELGAEFTSFEFERAQRAGLLVVARVG